MNGSHVAGGGLGAVLGVVLASLNTRLGLHLTTADAASLAVGATGVGLAFGHAFGKAWEGPGVFPALHRGFFGPKQPAAQSEPAPAPPPAA